MTENLSYQDYLREQQDLELIQKYTERPEINYLVETTIQDMKNSLLDLSKFESGEKSSKEEIIGRKIAEEKELKLKTSSTHPIHSTEVNFEPKIGLESFHHPRYRQMSKNQWQSGNYHSVNPSDYAVLEQQPKFDKYDHKKETNKKLKKRKKLFNKYTKINPEISKRVRSEIDSRSRKKKVKLPNIQYQTFEDQPYVYEQIRAKMLKHRKKKISYKDINEIDDFEVVEKIIEQSEQKEQRAQKLINIIELMDTCLKKQTETRTEAPSHFSSVKGEAASQPKSQTMSMMISPKNEASFQEKKIFTPKKKNKNFKRAKIVKGNKRNVKVIERNFELDKDSYEVSDLLTRHPSKVYNLDRQVVKNASEHNKLVQENKRQILSEKEAENLDLYVGNTVVMDEGERNFEKRYETVGSGLDVFEEEQIEFVGSGEGQVFPDAEDYEDF